MMTHDLTLEDLHYYMEGLKIDLETLALSDTPEEMVESGSLWHVCEASVEFFGSGYHSELVRRFGIPPKLANQFIKNFGSVSVREATIVASKLLVYLRGIEGELTEKEANSEPHTPTPSVAAPIEPPPDRPVTITAVQWVALPQTNEIKLLITQIAHLLDNLMSVSKSSNLPDEHRALSKIERAELIAILETALQMLKAPLVEKGLLRKAGKGLGNVVEKVASKQAESVLGALAGEAQKAIVELISKIPWN